MKTAKTLFRWLTARDWAVALLLGVIAAILMAQYWGPPVHFIDPDALFYQAQSQEVQGSGRQEALDEVFSSSLADELKEGEADIPPAERKVDNAEWVEYSSQFYRRRWTLPVVAAATEPVLGDGTLENLSLGFYVIGTMLLYLLLRRRFSQLVAFLVTGATLLLPPLRLIASDGLTDSLGLALLYAALLCVVLALERDDRRWLWAWVPVVVALSFTRDYTLILVISTAWLAFRMRTRISYWLLGTGILASLPAPLVAGAPFRENLAYVIDGYHVPTDDSWSYVISHYPHQLWDTLSHDLTYPLDFRFPLPMFVELLVILAGIATLVLLASRGDFYIQMMRAALVGGIITILISVNYTEWRLELAMLPSIAVGVALLTELVIARLPNGLGGDRLRPLARREARAAA